MAGVKIKPQDLAGNTDVFNDLLNPGSSKIKQAAAPVTEEKLKEPEKDVHLSTDAKEELKGMMAIVRELMKDSLDMFVTGDMTNMEKVRDLENKTDELERELQNKHIQRLSEGLCSAQAGVFFSDIISGIERVGDHATNIAFSLYDAKNRRNEKAG